MYKITEYNYELPKSLISYKPSDHRGNSRLLYFNRSSGVIGHHRFNDIVKFFKSSDILVVNDTRVYRGRLIGVKKSGGRVEVLLLDFEKLLRFTSDKNLFFKCLISASKRLSIGSVLFFQEGLKAQVNDMIDGMYIVKFKNGILLKRVLNKFGCIPLPPYIKRKYSGNYKNDSYRYQTVYANNIGSVASPTAGLHMTKELFESLIIIGVTIVKVTLHVGYTTFRTIKTEDIRQHEIYPERFFINKSSANIISKAKVNGNRIIAVGTTTVRLLEFLANKYFKIDEGEGWCDLYIYPGYEFKLVDAIITNFHLPCSSLLLLISAFFGEEKILDIYKIAVEKGYRFFSYGDAMLIE